MNDHNPATAVRARRSRWEEQLARVQSQFPSTTTTDWTVPLRDYEFMGSLLRQVIQMGSSPHRNGYRPVPEPEVGMAHLRALLGESYTVQPFHTALSILALDRCWSRTILARKTGISRTRVHRLMSGETTPTGADMEAVAAAFDKAPEFFAEYRVAAVLALFSHYLSAAPDASVAVLRQLRSTYADLATTVKQ